MLSIVSLKWPMLREDGTASSIDYKTRFISIGKKLIRKLPPSLKQRKNKIKPKTLSKFSN